MARRANKSRVGRVISNPPLQRYRRAMPQPRPQLSAPRPRSLRSGPFLIKPIGDRRLFHPAPVFSRPALSTRRIASRLVTPTPFKRARLMSARSNGWATAFQNPPQVMICVRRKIRREVIHALGLGGASGMVPRRRNPFSEVSC